MATQRKRSMTSIGVQGPPKKTGKWVIPNRMLGKDELCNLFEISQCKSNCNKEYAKMAEKKTLNNAQNTLQNLQIRAGFSISKMESICNGLLDSCPSHILQLDFGDFLANLGNGIGGSRPHLESESDITQFVSEFVKFLWWATTNVDKLPTDILLRLIVSACSVPASIEFASDFPLCVPTNAQGLMARELEISCDEALAKWKTLPIRDRRVYHEKMYIALDGFAQGCEAFVRANSSGLTPGQREHVEEKQMKVERAQDKLKGVIAKMDEKEKEEAAAEAALFEKFRSALMKELPESMPEIERERVAREKYADIDPIVLKAFAKMDFELTS